ncbi:hypothetical protein GUJ93_ZPchr0006g44254 [Zizania palustris]|uniref:Uncharacterized protein n=1 Tax=Zizania palustris TaxID=103762 RepID=A0A8J5W3A8_ZIZPA|nr:hypothetical protein GUJ93_ZPchr0006g44254 [Zizania palustris]
MNLKSITINPATARVTMSKTLLVILSLLHAMVAAMPVMRVEQADDVSTYIVHVAHEHAAPPASPSTGDQDHIGRTHYTSFLRGILPSHISEPEPSLIYAYSHAATGFAVRMSKHQAAHVEGHQGVLAVIPDGRHELHTTLSPSFLHLSPSSGLVLVSNGGTGVVIAILDTGIYPKDRRSFAADPSLPPPPRTFRGGCVSTPSFNATAYCNNKLVGAKYFYRGYEASIYPHRINETEESKSALDTNGHGTHTASTAAGSQVPGANLFGYANGTAQGMAVRAHIAAYKVCWGIPPGCHDSDILAGMDEAISDRVDVISLSLGGPSKYKGHLYNEATAIGSFNAIRKGIFVSASAGNNGPELSTATNEAPWIMTVGASSLNRRFPARVVLGNGRTYVGSSLFSGQNTVASLIPLVYGGDAGSDICFYGNLSRNIVGGKIVLCEDGGNLTFSTAQEVAVRLAGGIGTIISSRDVYGDFIRTLADIHPATTVTFSDFRAILTYKQSVRNPVARMVFDGTTISQSPSAPRVAAFSSRGPNSFAAEILKPDVIAPGVEILAAWTGEAAPSFLKFNIDNRPVEFNIISGTSMACPHVSGIAAMLKVARPSWSPTAIKSALMTTAYNSDNSGNPIKSSVNGQAAGPFELGSGHVDPNRALDPGLVYDATPDDYITFLCALKYTSRQIALFTKDGTVTDCRTRPQTPVGDLNYPAFSVAFGRFGGRVTQRRTVTNVGANTNVVYDVNITAPLGTTLTVAPRRLAFNAQVKTLPYSVTLSARANTKSSYEWGSIVWNDGQHAVRSPVVVTWA